MEELCHLWCYAEDLESYETACKELVNCYAQVRPGSECLCAASLIRVFQDAHPDMIDEVRDRSRLRQSAC